MGVSGGIGATGETDGKITITDGSALMVVLGAIPTTTHEEPETFFRSRVPRE
jgi:hypothetical protein